MTDREMLEWAAKAAGMNTHRYCEFWNAMAAYTPENGYYGLSWNPLIDDGDALRLAVALNTSLEVSEYESSTYAYVGPATQDACRPYAMELWASDKAAATRRAIVRAAAEIGKAMP